MKTRRAASIVAFILLAVLASPQVHAQQTSDLALPSFWQSIESWFSGLFVRNDVSTPPASAGLPTQQSAPIQDAAPLASSPSPIATSSSNQHATTSLNVKSASQSQSALATESAPAVIPNSTAAISSPNYVTQNELAGQLNDLRNSLQQGMFWTGTPVVSGPSAPVSLQTFAPSQAIDQLTNTSITNATVHGLSGLTAADIPSLNYLSSSGGTVSGLANFSNASTTLFSAYGPAYFGATGTSTFGTDGSLTLANNSGIKFTETGGHTGSGITVNGSNVFQINGDGPGGGASTVMSFVLGNTTSQVTLGHPVLLQMGDLFSTTVTPRLYAALTPSGTVTSGSAFYNQIGSASDSVNTTGGSGPGGADMLYIGHNFGGTTMTGNRTALVAQVNLTSTSGNSGDLKFYTAMEPFATAAVNDNGTGGSPSGNLFGINPNVQLNSGATFWNSLVGNETDIQVQAGASVAYKIGQKIVQLSGDATQGSTEDAALSFDNQANGTAPGWNDLITVGGPEGWWPVKSTGTILGTNPATISGGPSYNAAYGIDFSGITFGIAFLKSNGFQVDGSGSTTVSSINVNGGATTTGNAYFAGNVGIGTTTPSTTFGLVGSQYLTGGIGVGVLNTTTGTLQTSGLITGGSTLTLSGTTATTTIASGQGFTIGGSQLVMQQGSGNVGIGTAAPQGNLNIYAASGNSLLRIQNAATGNGANSGLFIGQLGGSNAFITNQQNAQLSLGTNNIGRVTIDSGGNVGIGTSTPDSLLSLQTTSSTGPQTSFGNTANGREAFVGLNDGFNAIVNITGGGSDLLQKNGTTYLTIGSNANSYFNTGNVGVGTTTPWRTFSVNGTVGLAGLTSDSADSKVLCLTANNEVVANAGTSCITSSQRFKNSIVSLDATSGLAEVLNLNAVSFQYNSDIGIQGTQVASSPNKFSRSTLVLLSWMLQALRSQ